MGKAPSTLRLILPESCLEGPNVETDIMEINNTMTRYLRENQFVEYPHSMIYVERVMTSGRIRRGLVGMVDLEQYDYEPGSGAMSGYGGDRPLPYPAPGSGAEERPHRTASHYAVVG